MEGTRLPGKNQFCETTPYYNIQEVELVHCRETDNFESGGRVSFDGVRLFTAMYSSQTT